MPSRYATLKQPPPACVCASSGVCESIQRVHVCVVPNTTTTAEGKRHAERIDDHMCVCVCVQCALGLVLLVAGSRTQQRQQQHVVTD